MSDKDFYYLDCSDELVWMIKRGGHTFKLPKAQKDDVLAVMDELNCLVAEKQEAEKRLAEAEAVIEMVWKETKLRVPYYFYEKIREYRRKYPAAALSASAEGGEK